MHGPQQRSGRRHLIVLPHLETRRNLTGEKTQNVHPVGLSEIFRGAVESLLFENPQKGGDEFRGIRYRPAHGIIDLNDAVGHPSAGKRDRTTRRISHSSRSHT
nr:hypothetical protein pFRL5_335c [Streptomyces sp. F8]